MIKTVKCNMFAGAVEILISIYKGRTNIFFRFFFKLAICFKINIYWYNKLFYMQNFRSVHCLFVHPFGRPFILLLDFVLMTNQMKVITSRGIVTQAIF